MTESKKLDPAAIIALKEALAQIYWYKKDLRSFLINTLSNSSILSNINWDDYKRNITDLVVESLARNESRYRDELIRLFTAVAAVNDFSHLEFLDDGKVKVIRAKKAVEALKKYTSGYQKIWDEKQKTDERRSAYIEKIEHANLFKSQLDSLNKEYCQLVISKNFQERGYSLEKILKQLFELFDLDPKASFKIEGEQLDGAFTFDGADYLFEAKWQNELVRANALDSLASKVQRKLDNTLGLFLSINGFSQDGISAHALGRKVILLMDGGDIMAVLEGRIEFPELLKRKRRHAAQTGEIYIRFQDMLE
ncbi:MAG TPA: hypothetical protein VGK00_01245 [Anaerolineales bacterium]|jgi:hypothetical protein